MSWGTEFNKETAVGEKPGGFCSEAPVAPSGGQRVNSVGEHVEACWSEPVADRSSHTQIL